MTRNRLAAVAATLFCTLLAAPATAAPVETVIQDDAVLLHSPEPEIRDALAQIKALGIDRVRVTAGWSVIAPKPDSATIPANFDPADPAAYPHGNWMNLDRIVRLATAAGLKLDIDIAFWAPRWATKDPATETARLRTEIDPTAYTQFARAVARRYAGGYRPPRPPAGASTQPEPSPDNNFLTALLGPPKQQSQPAPAQLPQPEPLPAVDMFTIWNEPNHPGFMQPQWIRGANGEWVPHSPTMYRALVRAAYPVIKAEAPASRVLIGGLASMGSSEPGKSGITPLKFLRALTCVDDQLQPVTTGACEGYTTLPGDGWAHHPYSLQSLPNKLPNDSDKLPVANTALLAKTLRTLVESGRLARANAAIYMTEYGYETNKPDPQAMFGPERQAELLAWAEYLATKVPAVRMWPQFLLRDRPGAPAGPQMRPFGDWQTGLLYEDGSAKPAFDAYKKPTFATCERTGKKRQVLVWGRLRGGPTAAVRVETSVAGAPFATMATRRSPRPRAARAASVSVGGGGAVARYAPWRRGATYRIVWSTPAGAVAGPSVTAQSCKR